MGLRAKLRSTQDTLLPMNTRKLWFTLALLLLMAHYPHAAQAAPLRVGLQVGHLRSNELPEELKALRTSTGAAAGGYREVEVNQAVAERAASYLRGVGFAVDVLPATVPPSYRADAFVAIHADGNADPRMRGFKAATHWREWEAATTLLAAMRAEYGAASGLAWDEAHISSGMRGYYAMSTGRYRHAVANTTPAIILEMGYLTNPQDRQLMTQQVDRLARGVAAGVQRFFASKPASGWPAPPPLPEFRAVIIAPTANIRSGPSTNYDIVRVVEAGRMLLVERVQGQWLKLQSRRAGERWIHRDLVRLERISDDPPQA